MTSATFPHASRQVAGAGQLWLQAWEESRQAWGLWGGQGLVFGPFEEAAGEGDWEGGDRGLFGGAEAAAKCCLRQGSG